MDKQIQKTYNELIVRLEIAEVAARRAEEEARLLPEFGTLEDVQVAAAANHYALCRWKSVAQIAQLALKHLEQL